MPYIREWRSAEVFLTHRGWVVYHAYQEDDFEQRAENYYLWEADGTFYDDSFDVRGLPTYDPQHPDPKAAIKNYITLMIKAQAELEKRYQGHPDYRYVEIDHGSVIVRFEGLMPHDFPREVCDIPVYASCLDPKH